MYNFTIFAVNDAGRSATGARTPPAVPGVTLPLAPARVSAKALYANHVDLNWVPVPHSDDGGSPVIAYIANMYFYNSPPESEKVQRAQQVRRHTTSPSRTAGR